MDMWVCFFRDSEFSEGGGVWLVPRWKQMGIRMWNRTLPRLTGKFGCISGFMCMGFLDALHGRCAEGDTIRHSLILSSPGLWSGVRLHVWIPANS